MSSNSASSQLIEAAAKIDSILKQIQEINSTTKLIAINAAIESSLQLSYQRIFLQYRNRFVPFLVVQKNPSMKFKA